MEQLTGLPKIVANWIQEARYDPILGEQLNSGVCYMGDWTIIPEGRYDYLAYYQIIMIGELYCRIAYEIYEFKGDETHTDQIVFKDKPRLSAISPFIDTFTDTLTELNRYT